MRNKLNKLSITDKYQFNAESKAALADYEAEITKNLDTNLFILKLYRRDKLLFEKPYTYKHAALAGLDRYIDLI